MSTAEHDVTAATTRRSRGRPRVPFDRIVTTALRIVDEDGADALSMRTLAQRLDSSTAVLYRAVANRAELIGHVVDWVFGEIEFDPDVFGDADWPQGCRSAAQAMFDTLRSHRGIARLLIEQVPTGPNTLALREQFLAMLLANGFAPDAAARAYATIARYVLGFAAQLHGHNTAENIDATTLSTLYHELDPTRFPATVAVADYLPAQTLEEEFGFGLQLIVAGLTAHHESTAGR
ncbi:TetR/AcrR family transcriptional regulator C-terminal domain-containing protein [Nocardia sp. NPDC052112]|uniref:TetR/AcrR family transcriptional regulator n=1 Tax=Nocardia sp. NPDC052112 TaxID=3155646 RepID=UPI00341A0E91